MALPLASALVALVLALVLTPLVSVVARRAGLVAAPRADRWHRRPTPNVGGIAVFLAFWGGKAISPSFSECWPLSASVALLFVVGLIDDVVQLAPLTKLAAQIAAAAIVVGAGVHLPWTAQPLVDGAITLVWLVGITNAINLLDNMDGLAAGVGAIAAVFLTVTFMLNGQRTDAAHAMSLAGALAGFLAYNFNPASIFMGDCGSMFVGAALGGKALLSEYGRSRNLTAVLFTPVVILMIPILDTCLVTITRKLRGQPVSVGGRDHSSHRLVALGVSERRAVLILYALATVCGLFALVLRGLELRVAVPALGAFAIGMTVFGAYLARVPLQPRTPTPEPSIVSAPS